MRRVLYLLVTSERPDTYLNSIAHCLLHEGVQEVEFLHVQGLEESLSAGKVQVDKKSATVSRYVTTLLQDLVTLGEYRFFVGEEAGTKVDLRQVYAPDRFAAMQEIYGQCLRLEQWNHRDISYSDLRKEIAAIAAKKPPAIVDVTSVKKTVIGDLVAAGVIEGLSSLHTFELIPHPDYENPWTMLFHDLKASNSSAAKYRYVNLLDTPVFKECARSLLVKRPSLRVSLVIAVILLLATLIAYFVGGTTNSFVQATVLLSAIASLLSLFYNFFPIRRS